MKKLKKTVLILALTTIIEGSLMMSCKSSTKEEKESQLIVVKDNDTMKVSNKEANAVDLKAFKKETDSIINENKAKIDVLKLKMKKKGESIDASYQKNIANLEQKNKNLKIKMETYKNDANSDWQSFKREFNHDLDEIGQAFKDLTVDNKE